MSAVQVAEAPQSQSRFAHPRKSTASGTPPIIVAPEPLVEVEKFDEFHFVVYEQGWLLAKQLKEKRKRPKDVAGLVAEAKAAYRRTREAKRKLAAFEKTLLVTEKEEPRMQCGFTKGQPHYITTRHGIESLYDRWIKSADNDGDRDEIERLRKEKRAKLLRFKQITEARVAEQMSNGRIAAIARVRGANAYYAEIRYEAFHVPIRSVQDCRWLLDYIAWSCRIHDFRDQNDEGGIGELAHSYVQSAANRINQFLAKKDAR